jgi:hypothetical protein
MVTDMLRIEARWRTSGTSTGSHRVLLSESRIQTKRIAVPQIDGSAGQGTARPHIEHHDSQRERHPSLAQNDIRPQELISHVIRPNLLLRNQLADIG